MSKKVLTKLTALTLAILLSCANLPVIAASVVEEIIKDTSISFKAYLEPSEGEETLESKQDIYGENNKIYFKITAGNDGYLKSSKIEILNSEGNKNEAYTITSGKGELPSTINSINEEENSLVLNQINTNSGVTLGVPVIFNRYDSINLANLTDSTKIRLTGIYVNEKGKEVNIEKETELSINWNADATPSISETGLQVKTYEKEGKKGLIISNKIDTSVVDSKLPVKNTTIDIPVPDIGGILPEAEQVKVIALSTASTNGEEKAESFDTSNWTYDRENKKITIKVTNDQDSEGKVNWKKSVKDEYVVVFIYSETAISKIEEENVEFNSASTVSMEFYGAKEEGIKTEKVKTEKTTLTAEKISNAEVSTVEYTLENSNSSMSKGSLYTKNEMTYNTTLMATVLYSAKTGELELKTGTDTFLKEDSTILMESGAKYTQTKIAKSVFEKMLGANGKIEIYDNASNLLGTIDAKTVADDKANLVVTYNKDVTELVIKTTKPITEGQIEITNTKSIIGVAEKEELLLAKYLRTNLNNVYTRVQLTEPVTKAEISVSPDTLSSAVENKNVEIKVVLVSTDSNYDLYKNPTLQIELPSYIEKIDINKIDPLFDKNLSIEKYEILDTNDGVKKLVIQVEGEQTGYITDGISNGVTVLINANIKVKKLTPSTEGILQLEYMNENATTYENNKATGKASCKLNVESPKGVVTLTTVKGYNGENEINSLNNVDAEAKLEIAKEAKTANVTLSILNNDEKSLTNTKVLGRTPSSGLKDIETVEELNTNLDLKLKNAISVTGLTKGTYTIYYSENINATEDIDNTENKWSNQITDYSKVRSYLIVLNENLSNADGFDITFDLDIPANLVYNQTTYMQYKTIYTLEGASTSSVNKSPKITFTTGKGPELVLEKSISVGNDSEVKEGQIVKYTLKLTNNGTSPAESVILTDNIPEGAVYTEYKVNETDEVIEGGEEVDESSEDGEEVVGQNITDEMIQADSNQTGYNDDENKKEITWELGNIEQGETIEKTFEVRVKQKDNNTDFIMKNTAKATATNIPNEVISNTLENKVEDAKVTVELRYSDDLYLPETVYSGEELEYIITITNIEGQDLKNIETIVPIDSSLKYVSSGKYIWNEEEYEYDVEQFGEYNEKTRELKLEIDELKANEKVEFALVLEPNNEISEASKVANIYVETTVDKETTRSNEMVLNLEKVQVEVSMDSNKLEEYVNEGEKIEYTIKVKNKNISIPVDVIVNDIVPEELEVNEIKYVVTDGEETTLSGTNSIEIEEEIPANGELVIKIKTTVEKLSDDVEERTIKNSATIKVAGNEVKTNEVSTTIQKVKKDEQGNVVSQGFKISGTAWIDENENGSRDNDEKILSGITVKLINSKTGDYVADSSGNVITAKTDDSGKYTFEALASGEFMVVFEYDTNQYKLAEYQKTGVDASVNSDVINATITENDVKRLVAVTNVLDCTTTSKANIDMGLVYKKNFDLSLEKTITKITMQNYKTTKTYDYKDEQLAKIDLDGKYINSTTLVIEYKIKVTNNGELAGYAKRIVDYLPSDVKFSSELNKDWYTTRDGNAYTNKFANEIINPGETKEISLIVTKACDENNTGIINNTAEIYEAYNEFAISDTDSIPANKISTEDDFRGADVVISINTGRAVMYVILTMTIIIAIGIGAYLVNKKVLKV